MAPESSTDSASLRRRTLLCAKHSMPHAHPVPARLPPFSHRFVLLSDTDVPLYDPLTFYQQLMHEGKSRVRACRDGHMSIDRWKDAMAVSARFFCPQHQATNHAWLKTAPGTGSQGPDGSRASGMGSKAVKVWGLGLPRRSWQSPARPLACFCCCMLPLPRASDKGEEQCHVSTSPSPQASPACRPRRRRRA